MIDSFYITKGIDLDKLNDRIEKYELRERERPYVFMSTATANAAFPYHECVQSLRTCNGVVALYRGYNVFINNSLSFGEVELR